MLYQLIRSILKLERLDTYPSKWAFIGEFLGIFISVIIYYFTAKAFAPNLNSNMNFYKMDYFSFVLIGELSLALPIYLMTNPAIRLRYFVNQRVLTTLLSYPISLLKIIILWVKSGAIAELTRVALHIFIALFFFDLSISLKGFLFSIAILIFTLPTFLGLGLIAASISMILGRGSNVINYLSTVSLFFAGAYFPVEVFPTFIQRFASTLSPFNSTLYLIRNSYLNDFNIFNTSHLSIIASLLIWNFLALTIGITLIRFAETSLIKKGTPLLFTRT